jgi:hypothetical protein
MEHEQEKIHCDDFAEIWQRAQHRRSRELFTEVVAYFRKRQLKAATQPSYPSSQPAIIK